jgi:uncharacterized protein
MSEPPDTIEPEYRMHLLGSIHDIPAQAWDSLLADRQQDVLSSHAMLACFEDSGSVDGAVKPAINIDKARSTGWVPRHLAIQDAAGQWVAAMPLYEKWHSYGEYVFDWAWAQAYERNGLSYYPKLLSAIPFSPVPGARWLGDQSLAPHLLLQLGQWARQQGLSSIHILLPQPAVALEHTPGWMQRHGVQFHWQNAGYADFEGFLSTLTQPKRKKIRAERRKVLHAGVHFERLRGEAITDEHWDFFYHCYCTTYAEHHSTPYLTREFFRLAARRLASHWLMVVAYRNGRMIAASLLIIAGSRLLGRYWGAIERVDCLHFEAAYYQSIEAAIELRLERVEGGAQGEHKLARGFEPVPTCSWHWLAQPAFAKAVQRYLDEEGPAIGQYLSELEERAPFKRASE